MPETSPTSATESAGTGANWPRARVWQLAAAALLLFQAVLIGTTFRDYGMSWDQSIQREYGLRIIDFYASFGEDVGAATHPIRFYGALFEVAAWATERVSGLGWAEARNLCSALFGWVGLLAAMHLGWRLFGPRVGLLAGIFVFATPLYYGHSFINPKDLPYAALYLVAIGQMVRLLQSAGPPGVGLLVCTGLAIGAASAVRVGGLLLLPLLGLCLLLRTRDGSLSAGRAAYVGGVVGLLAWLTMVLAWPFAWLDPLGAPLQALTQFSKHSIIAPVFFDGQRLQSDGLPWTYLPVQFFRSLPEFVLLGLGLALWLAWRVGWKGLTPARTLLVLAGLAPLVLVLTTRAHVYDGLRHVLFAVLPLVIGAAAAWERTWASLPRPGLRWALGLLLAGLWAWTVSDLVRLHPYQYIYVNRCVAGGVAAAQQRYDLDFWATGLREAALWAREKAPRPAQGPLLYRYRGGADQVSYYLEADPARPARLAGRGERPHLILLPCKEERPALPPEARLVHVVKCDGVPLVEVFALAQ